MQGVVNYQSRLADISSNMRGVVALVRQRLEQLPNTTVSVGSHILNLTGVQSGLVGRTRRTLATAVTVVQQKQEDEDGEQQQEQSVRG